MLSGQVSLAHRASRPAACGPGTSVRDESDVQASSSSEERRTRPRREDAPVRHAARPGPAPTVSHQHRATRSRAVSPARGHGSSALYDQANPARPLALRLDARHRLCRPSSPSRRRSARSPTAPKPDTQRSDRPRSWQLRPEIASRALRSLTSTSKQVKSADVAWRHTQVVKGEVCKTSTPRFESGCRLHPVDRPCRNLSRALGGST